jgi:hypothetical protein
MHVTIGTFPMINQHGRSSTCPLINLLKGSECFHVSIVEISYYYFSVIKMGIYFHVRLKMVKRLGKKSSLWMDQPSSPSWPKLHSGFKMVNTYSKTARCLPHSTHLHANTTVVLLLLLLFCLNAEAHSDHQPCHSI